MPVVEAGTNVDDPVSTETTVSMKRILERPKQHSTWRLGYSGSKSRARFQENWARCGGVVNVTWRQSAHGKTDPSNASWLLCHVQWSARQASCHLPVPLCTSIDHAVDDWSFVSRAVRCLGFEDKTSTNFMAVEVVVTWRVRAFRMIPGNVWLFRERCQHFACRSRC